MVNGDGFEHADPVWKKTQGKPPIAFHVKACDTKKEDFNGGDMEMKKNVGGWDRNTRWIVGAGAVLAGLFAPLPKSWRVGLLGLGTAQIVTAAAQYCPVNQMLGIDTRHAESAKELVRGVARAAL